MKSLKNSHQTFIAVFVLLFMIVIMVVSVFQFGETNLVFAKHGYESPSRDPPNCNISNQGNHNNNACGNIIYAG